MRNLLLIFMLFIIGCADNTWQSRVELDGRHARSEGVPATANPYIADCDKASRWLNGWINEKMREEGRLGTIIVRDEHGRVISKKLD